MPLPPQGSIHVKLGDLAHADVAVPGRRLMHHPQHGWVAEVDRPAPWRGWSPGHLRSLPVWASLLLPLVVFVGMLLPRQAGVGAAHDRAAHPGAPASGPAAAFMPTVPGRQAPLPAQPAVAARLPTFGSAPPASVPLSGTTLAMSDAVAAPQAARSAGASRRPSRSSAAASPRPPRGVEPASGPAAPVVFNETPVTEVRPRSRDVLVAIKDTQTIVVPGLRGLPIPFRVGEQLPSGARLLRVDVRAGEAETDRGVLRLE